MKITKLSLEQFRNMENTSFCPGEGVNVIYGDNAQGKTNLIEAIYLFTGLKSFRSSRDAQLIMQGRDFSKLNMEFEAGGRSQEASLRIDKGRHVILNDVDRGLASAMTGIFCACLFSPDHLELIKDGPALRRKFLDSALCVISKRYQKLLLDYNKVLTQRNSLLKDVAFSSDLLSMLDVWDQSAAKLGAAILDVRRRYVKRLDEEASKLYEGISGGKEQFSMTYQCMEYDSPDEVGLLKAMLRARPQDVRNGVSSIGPHRDDLEILINGMSAREFGSQGQQRSCVLALKLAEANILSDSVGEPCVILLDDVMSELDNTRKEFLLNRLKGQQIFITCCDVSYFSALKEGNVFEVKQGMIFQRQ